MVLSLQIQQLKAFRTEGDWFLTKTQGITIIKSALYLNFGPRHKREHGGISNVPAHSFPPLYLDFSFQLSQIRCTNALTQNVVIDVFDELILHLHKGHKHESLKCIHCRGSTPPAVLYLHYFSSASTGWGLFSHITSSWMTDWSVNRHWHYPV